jgi:hypothetical protein
VNKLNYPKPKLTISYKRILSVTKDYTIYKLDTKIHKLDTRYTNEIQRYTNRFKDVNDSHT